MAKSKNSLLSPRNRAILLTFFKSLVLSLFVLLGATSIIFFTVYLAPGSAKDVWAITVDNPTDVNPIQEEEQPVKMYLSWLIDILHLDFGISDISGLPVLYELTAPLKNTLILTFGSLFITLVIAVPIGFLSATLRHPLLSRIASTIAYLVSAAPVYWMGYIVIYIFTVKFHWFPLPMGLEPAHLGWIYFILPVFLLGIGNGALGEIIRHIREEGSNILQQEYIQAAFARGVNVWKHVAKNAIVPIISIITSRLTLLLGGAIVVEYVFSFPGIGYKAFTAADEQDYPIILGITVLLVIFVRLIKIASDFSCSIVDPRFLSGGSNEN